MSDEDRHDFLAAAIEGYNEEDDDPDDEDEERRQAEQDEIEAAEQDEIEAAEQAEMEAAEQAEIEASRKKPAVIRRRRTQTRGYEHTQLGNAERLMAKHGESMRYVHAWKSWHVFDGRRWAKDDRGVVGQHAAEIARGLFDEAKAETDDHRRNVITSHANRSCRNSEIEGMVQLSAKLPNGTIAVDDLNKDPWLFNVQNGTIDLHTGELRPHRREDFITQIAPVEYHPDAACPLWMSTLELFFNSDRDLIEYWQRLCGYAMVGVVRENILPVCYGTGANGKSTIIGTLLELFGDYAAKASPDLLLARSGRDGTNLNDRANLFGKRLVAAIETDRGKHMNEAQVKELTSYEPIVAKRLYQDQFEFTPTHTLMLATNHLPVIKSADDGIWRRLKRIPFTVTMPPDRADTSMPDRLRAEYPGILAWCVQGCLAWQKQSLNADEPEVIARATGDYREDQDTFGQFLAEHTVQGPGKFVKASHLYHDYRQWAELRGEKAMAHPSFGRAIEERGFEKKRKADGVQYLGIGQRDDREPPAGI